LFGLVIRQGTEQDGVQYTEDCRIGTDPDSERDDGHNRKDRFSQETSDSVLQVSDQ
jgi:hypothetical protein